MNMPPELRALYERLFQRFVDHNGHLPRYWAVSDERYRRLWVDNAVWLWELPGTVRLLGVEIVRKRSPTYSYLCADI